MNWQHTAKTFLTRWSNKRLRSPGVIYQPLLNNSELQELQQAALAASDNPFLIDGDVQQQLLGERTSSFAGSGYEFAEHRRYVAGDDVRSINWRAMARTGKLYRKVFHEERRPQFYLLVDRRAPMRFGTRGQLKVTRAVRQAIQLLYQARQQQLVTGCVILEDKAIWIKPGQGATDLHMCIQQLNSPCPPQPLSQQQAPLDSVLSELVVRLAPGCIIFILSDFHDLQANSSATLYHLAQQHQLHTLHIIDPIEQKLPAASHYQLHDEVSDKIIDIHAGNQPLKQQFEQAMRKKQKYIEQLITQAGGQYRILFTNDQGESHG